MARLPSPGGRGPAGHNRPVTTAAIAFDASAWTSFFVASATAAATLSGLIFVAVSINLEHIVVHPSLPGRALETIVVLVQLLLVALAGLLPGQSRTALGIEVLVVAAVAWAIPLELQRRDRSRAPSEMTRSRKVIRGLYTQAATLPFLVAGVSLIVCRGGGLYWTAVGAAGAVVAAITGAWILLVEIRR